jgi:hypothetical protein
LAIGFIVWAGQAGAVDGVYTTDPTSALAERVRQLESESAAMQTELQALRQQAAAPQQMQVLPVTTDSTVVAEDTGEAVLYTSEELAAEVKKHMWMKGDYKIVPYGSLWGSASFDSQRSFPGAFVLFNYSATNQNQDAFNLDTRRSRLGLDVTGPRVPWFCDANSRAKVEIDFHGQFVEKENQATIQIRHAYAEVYDDQFRLLGGQTWDLHSPLVPHTVNYSVGWGGGNIGFRRMQLRYERYLACSDVFLITPAIAACQNVVVDGPAAGREPTDWPVMEGRVGFTFGERGEGCKPIVFGISGHVGEQGFDFLPLSDSRVRTWSVNADVVIPITDRFSFQGEFFTGADLSTYMGGIVQGVDFFRREAIYSTGGWFEFGYDLTDNLHTYTGYTIDDPWNDTISPGGDVLIGNGARVYNRSLFANVIFDVTKKIKFGLEVSSWDTHYLVRQPGESLRFEFAGQYDF